MDEIRSGKQVHTERNHGIDLLRIVSMLMVVSLHYLGKGGFLEKGGEDTSVFVVAWLLESLSIAAVNTYALISGYLLCQKPFRSGRILRLWFQTLFYSAGLTLVMMLPVPGGGQRPAMHEILMSIFPITMDHYWFMTAYVIMVLFSPLMNAALKRLDRKQHLILMCLLLGLFSLPKSILPVRLEFDDFGYSGLWFLVVYVVAAYLRRIRDEESENPGKEKRAGKYLGIYLLAVAAMWMVTLALDLIYVKTGHLWEIQELPMEYNYLFNIGGAVFLFLTFSHLPIRSPGLRKLIGWVSPYTLGVYLLHEHVLIRYEWPKLFGARGSAGSGVGSLMGYWFLAVVSVFVLGVLVDFIRERLFVLIGKTKVCRYWKEKLTGVDVRLEMRE